MLSAAELSKILADDETDWLYFRKFSELMHSKYPELSDEELRNRWVKLKADAGIVT